MNYRVMLGAKRLAELMKEIYGTQTAFFLQ
jgi:hypothetical protein